MVPILTQELFEHLTELLSDLEYTLKGYADIEPKTARDLLKRIYFTRDKLLKVEVKE